MTTTDLILTALNEKPSLDLAALADAVGASSIADIHPAVMELCDAKRVRATKLGDFEATYRLTNEERTRLRDQGPVSGDRQTGDVPTQQHETIGESGDRNTDIAEVFREQPREQNSTHSSNSSTADENVYGSQNRYSSLADTPEPTDAELDAIEAEDDDFEEIPGECPDLAVLRAEHATSAWEDNHEDVQPAACPAPPQDHVWGVAHDRPTKGLRIERVVEEFLAVEKRRQELLEELRGLVG